MDRGSCLDSTPARAGQPEPHLSQPGKHQGPTSPGPSALPWGGVTPPLPNPAERASQVPSPCAPPCCSPGWSPGFAKSPCEEWCGAGTSLPLGVAVRPRRRVSSMHRAESFHTADMHTHMQNTQQTRTRAHWHTSLAWSTEAALVEKLCRALGLGSVGSGWDGSARAGRRAGRSGLAAC